jgi:hypothetical protein
MAYTILKSDGTTLCTIPDGTINTTSSSLGLPGRNFSGYGNTLDTNFVHIMESFADVTPPANPLRGQLWFNTSSGSGGNTLYVCPSDGEANAAAWLALTSTTSGGAATFGSVTVTGNITANNITASNVVTGASGVFNNITVSGNANNATANVTTAIIGTTNTAAITSGSATTAGAITGTWTISGGSSGNSLIVANGNVYTSGIRTDNYYYANGTPFNPSGTYGNANVAAYLPTYTGNLQPSLLTTSAIAGGGTISGIWTLTVGARLNATYADLAERFEADTEYDAGTVVELGGDAEVTAVVHELSEDVFGVVSNTAAYLMNAGAGTDASHPPIAVGGRVQVKVTGKVRKGQRLVSAGNGIARAAKAGEATSFNTIGRALADKTDIDVGTVEAFVSIK